MDANTSNTTENINTQIESDDIAINAQGTSTQQLQQHQEQFGEEVDPDDPLLIAQTLTYVTDDGSVMLSFTSAPFSFGKLFVEA